MNSTFTLTLKLDINKNEEAYLNKVFHYANHIYNVGVKEIKRRFNNLYKDKTYQNIMNNYSKAKKFSNKEKALLKEIRIKYGLNSKQSIEEYLKKNRYQFDRYINATATQIIANDLFNAVEKILYENGEDIHFKKYKNCKSISGKSNKQGIRINENFETIYQHHKYKVTVRPKDIYAQTVLSYINFEQTKLPRKERNLNDKEYAINFCRIKRKRKGNHYKYYLEINLQGTPPHKVIKPKSNKVGIDIGTSTIAVCSKEGIIFKELNDGIEKIDKEIAILNRKADKLRRINNPNNFNPNGTIKKNTKTFKKVWYNSNKMKYLYNRISTLYSKRSAKLKQFQNTLAKEIIGYGENIYIENMNYQALAKKSKKTEISEKTGKCKKKKRFGKSIGIHAPAQLISIIETKLSYDNRTLIKVDNKAIKASQFNHITGEYIKPKLNQRWKTLEQDVNVQRDLYSAYLLSKVISPTEIDVQSCFDNFENFKIKHDELMNELFKQYQQNKKFPSCMGIKETLNYI